MLDRNNCRAPLRETESNSNAKQRQRTGILPRRGFLAAGLGSAILSTSANAQPVDQANGDSAEEEPNLTVRRLPREVRIATVCQNGVRADTPEQMVAAMLRRCSSAVTQKPDLVCLPEVFPCVNLNSGKRPALQQVAGSPLCQLTQPVADFARHHKCYIVCPTYTQHDGKFFNTAILFDRTGRVAGEYHKVRLTPGEVEKGLTPGPEQPQVFETDFGKLGCQICFDIEWLDGWQRLRDAGAEIVVWPSAFAGGRMVNTMAYLHRYVVVSSTRKDTSKVCDIDGTSLAKTSRWNRWAVTTVNLEKAFLHTWPFVSRFNEIHSKYGAAIRITTHPEEEWSIIESRSPDVLVADVLKEFELEQIDQFLARAEAKQESARG